MGQRGRRAGAAPTSRSARRATPLLLSVAALAGSALVGCALVETTSSTERSTTPPQSCPEGEHVFGWRRDGTVVCGDRGTWDPSAHPPRYAVGPVDPATGYRSGFPACDADEFERPCYRRSDGLVVLPGWPGYPSTTEPTDRTTTVPPPSTTSTVPKGPNGEDHPGCPSGHPFWVDDEPLCRNSG